MKEIQEIAIYRGKQMVTCLLATPYSAFKRNRMSQYSGCTPAGLDIQMIGGDNTEYYSCCRSGNDDEGVEKMELMEDGDDGGTMVMEMEGDEDREMDGAEGEGGDDDGGEIE